MLYAAKEIWSAIHDFMRRVTTLEGRAQKTERHVEHVENKVEVLERVVKHQGKVQEYHGQQLVEAQQEIKKLKSEKQGKAISAGIWKSKAEKAEKRKRPPKH